MINPTFSATPSVCQQVGAIECVQNSGDTDLCNNYNTMVASYESGVLSLMSQDANQIAPGSYEMILRVTYTGSAMMECGFTLTVEEHPCLQAKLTLQPAVIPYFILIDGVRAS